MLTSSFYFVGLLRRYQRYLESVLEAADEYQEVADLLLRHATLQATNSDLKEHQRRCGELAEKVGVGGWVGGCVRVRWVCIRVPVAPQLQGRVKSARKMCRHGSH